MAVTLPFRTPDPGWQGLYRLGGAAALLAGLVFRRNLGPEVSLFSAQPPPTAVMDWLTLLQTHPLLGLTYLDLFDLVDYLLVGLMFLALYAALKPVSRSLALVAAVLGWAGVTISLTANAALSLLTISNQYALATSETQRGWLLVSAQTLLAQNSPLHPGTGLYLGLLLLACAGLLFSSLMFRSPGFGRVTAFLGLLASGLDLIYCLTFAFLPVLTVPLLASAGLCLCLWHLLVARQLFQIEKQA